MKILITNNKLDTFGGTENWCLTMSQALIKLGHTVHIFSTVYGAMAKIMQQQGCIKRLDKEYDLILCNHTTTINNTHHVKGYKIQTIHSKFIDIERPDKTVDKHIAISREIQDYFKIDTLIYNPVNTGIFKPTNKVTTIHNVLCLSQGISAQKQVAKICDILQLQFSVNTKWHNPLNQIQLAATINWSDLVISVGRGVYEAVCCQRQVICYDERGYDNRRNAYALNLENFNEALYFNFTGRFGGNDTLEKSYLKLPEKPLSIDNNPFDYLTIAKIYLSLCPKSE